MQIYIAFFNSYMSDISIKYKFYSLYTVCVSRHVITVRLRKIGYHSMKSEVREQ